MTNSSNISILKTALIGLGVSVLLFWGCDQEQSPFPQDKSCFKGKVLKKVRDRQGVVAFDSLENTYSINSHVPGTYDSQDTGFLCTLPDSLRQAGRLVIFDGSYYQYDKKRAPRIGGETYYYLKITKLKEQ